MEESAEKALNKVIDIYDNFLETEKFNDDAINNAVRFVDDARKKAIKLTSLIYDTDEEVNAVNAAASAISAAGDVLMITEELAIE